MARSKRVVATGEGFVVCDLVKGLWGGGGEFAD